MEQAQVRSPIPLTHTAFILSSMFTSTGRVVAPSLWILLERLRDAILAGKCEMLDDCFVESS